ncbi:MAG: MATE family efflux transporter [Lachnospiraceae bacterium]|nr:MATE family efflux transporter [Lachnospiraceae bacterium]
MSKYIGDKKFYKKVLAVAIPIIIQNGITNFVNLLDNIMVGSIGTEQMSGVAIVNQLMFVFFLAIFGAVSGPGIFTAQYVGQKNPEGVRYTVRYKIVVVCSIAAVGTVIMLLFKDNLISLFLHEQGENIDPVATLGYARDYMNVMVVGMLPFAFTQSYAGTLRESGETMVPMKAGLVAVFVNLVLNYILIFGHFGAPKLGVVGAAVATVISRFVELLIVVIWTHTHLEKNEFARGLYKGFKVPGSLVFKITTKGMPLFANELLWSMGMTALTQCYSTRGLSVIAAFNISNVITNLFNVVMISMGSVVAIMIGQILGSGDMKNVVDTDRKLIAFSVFLSTVLGILLIILAPLFPMLYNTEDDIRKLATLLMRIAALFMPVGAFLNCAYFTLRSGGKTFITFLFDSAYLWLICWPVAYVLSRFTNMTIGYLYFCVLCIDFIKVLIGAIMLKKKIWIHDLVG